MKGTFWHSLRYGCIAVFLMTFVVGQMSAQDTPPLAFEWQHFEDGKLLQGEPWSPDNRYLAVGSPEDNAILLLDRETWEVDRRLELPATEWGASRVWWSANGRYITATISDTNSIELILLDANEGSSIHLTNLFPIIESPFEIQWMGDTNVLAVLTREDYAGRITLIDIVTQKIVRQLELHDYNGGHANYSFGWSPHLRLFAAPFDTTVTIGFWDEFGNLPSSLIQQDVLNPYLSASQCGITGADSSPTPEFNFTGMGGNSDLYDLQWSNDGRRLAFTIYYRIVICTLNGEMDAVTSIQQLGIPNPFYDPNDMNQQNQFNLASQVSWSPDDHWLLSSELYWPPEGAEETCGIAVFDVTQDFAYIGKIGEGFCHVGEVRWSPDGRQIAFRDTTGYWVGTLQGE